MKSAKEMSAHIRSKKKKMQDDPDVIDMGGSTSLDATDIYKAKQQEETDELDENIPKKHDDGMNTSPEAERKEEMKSQSNHKDDNANSQDNEKELLRKSRLKSKMKK